MIFMKGSPRINPLVASAMVPDGGVLAFGGIRSARL